MGDHGGVPRSASSKRETDRGTGGLRTHNDMTARLDANTHLHLDAHVDLDRFFQPFTLPSPPTSGTDPYCWGELLG